MCSVRRLRGYRWFAGRSLAGGAVARGQKSARPGRIVTSSLVRLWKLPERRLSRFLREPPSVRGAAATIVTATLVVVVGAGALMRVLDPHEYPNIGLGMWWAIQTVTTVGYGDVTPTNVVGRLVATFVMLEGIAFVAIVTAAITSTFVTRAARQYDVDQAKDEQSDTERIEARLDTLEQKIDSLAATLQGSSST